MATIKFAIVGSAQGVLYELDFHAKADHARAASFLLHAALDMVDLQVWTSSATYLKIVDRHNEQLVSAYVTPGGARLLLLHEMRAEDGVRAFFNEVHEVRAASMRAARAHTLARPSTPLPPQLYTKLLLNSFYVPGARIESADFDARVRALARRYLGFRDGA